VSIDGKLTRRSYVNKEGKTVYVTEVVIDSINSIGSKKDAASGLSINPTSDKKNETVKSIDASFPEQIVKQTSTNDVHKPEQPKFDNNQEVEWLDELNKE
jgi:single-stranded DNA-binding protein